MRKHFIILPVTILAGLSSFLNSCIIEKGIGVTYSLINTLNEDLYMVRYFRDSDTLLLENEEELSFSYYGETYHPSPFEESDSILFTNWSTLWKVYYQDSEGKNPFRDESYAGGEVESRKHITNYEFTYSIELEDFER